jgi:hypothetical protein
MMKEIVQIQVQKIIPDRRSILNSIGASAADNPEQRITNLIDKAMEIYVQGVSPVGIIREISIDEFASIYEGKGENEPETPLAEIFPKAVDLALFAVTLGQQLSDKISDDFKDNEIARGYVLDAVASEGAELAADAVQGRYHSHLLEIGSIEENTELLRYSPGYCGWHVSGQEKLFECLKPGEIGITLNESYLMEPLKSISGVIVSGERDIHLFENDFPFCAGCSAKSCLERFKLIKK